MKKLLTILFIIAFIPSVFAVGFSFEQNGQKKNINGEVVSLKKGETVKLFVDDIANSIIGEIELKLEGYSKSGDKKVTADISKYIDLATGVVDGLNINKVQDYYVFSDKVIIADPALETDGSLFSFEMPVDAPETIYIKVSGNVQYVEKADIASSGINLDTDENTVYANLKPFFKKSYFQTEIAIRANEGLEKLTESNSAAKGAINAVNKIVTSIAGWFI